MKRRSALAAFAAILAGCGGGADEEPASVNAPLSPMPASPAVHDEQAEPTTQAPATEPALQQAPIEPELAATPPRQTNIACWGDSITKAMAPRLAALYPARTLFNGGVSGETSGQIAVRALADESMTEWVTIFCFGRNNFSEPQKVIADLDASVTHLAAGNDRFLVLSVLNGSGVWLGDEKKGGAGYKQIMEINNALAAKYPENFLDIRAFLISHADSSLPQDLIDQQNDIVPTSLRTDVVHLTRRGYDLAAGEIKRLLDLNGW